MAQPHASTGEPVYRVVWPLGRGASGEIPLSAPINDLNGKTIGELWDWLFKGDEMFALVREQLRARYPGVKFVDYSAFGNMHGADEVEVIAALPELLRRHECDAVLSAVGA